MADSASLNATRTHRPFGWWVILVLLIAALLASQCSADDDDDPATVGDSQQRNVQEPDTGESNAGEPNSAPEGPDSTQDDSQETLEVETPPADAWTLPAAFLQQVGTRIVDGRGQPVTLRGINLGGWLMWEAWLWGGWGTPTANSESFILEKLTGAVGEESVERFRQQIYDSYITEADIARISELGFNMVRVPINHRAIEDPDRPGFLDAEGITRIDRLIDWAETHQVYVILDLHSAPGGQSVLFTADPDKTNLWESEAKADRTVSLWRELAGRYAEEEWIAGYDLLNEPMVLATSKLTSLYNRIIEAIRDEDPNHIVFVEGNWFAHVLVDLGDDLIDDDNLVYSFHAYEFSNRDLTADLATHVSFASERNRPLYAGEYGHASAEVIGAQTAQYRDTPEVVAWSSWTWKRTAVPDNPVIQEIQHPDSWHQVIATLTLGLPIGLFDVQKAMDEFVESVALEHCVENIDLARVS